MLQINMNQNITAIQAEEFENAVDFAQLNMEQAIRLNSIDKLDKKIDNKSGNYQVQEVDAFKAQKEALEKEVAECRIELDQLYPDYETVLNHIATKVNDAKVGEIVDNADEIAGNFIRLLGAANNHKLEKLALVNLGNAEMYDCFVTCHDINATTDNGRMTLNKEQKNAYKQAEQLVQGALRLALSIPENDYTEKYNISFNKTDMRLLHETFVKGFRNKYTSVKDSDGKDTKNFTFHGIEMNYAITRRKIKDSDEYSYNFEKFNEVVARIAIGKIAKKAEAEQA